jgi:hypothetical protein
MSEFTDQRRKIYDAAAAFISQFGEGANSICDQMADAEAKFEEQTVVIASQNETIKSLQEENERITADFQVRIDLQEQEITALRSQLGQKSKEFSGLSRTVHSMIISARNIVSLGAHGMNLVARDAVGDKIVTQLRGHPQRQTTAEGASLSSVLNAAGERLPTERERATG